MRILAYHAIADLREDPVLAEYAVLPALFAEHLDALLAAGWTFVDLDAVLGGLSGERPLPRRSVLLSFDDAYADLLESAAPLLVERVIPAVVFAVAALAGATNSWEVAKGAAALPLLDGEGLRALAARGIEVGSHTATHRALPDVPAAELGSELAGSASTLESLGLPRPRSLSYPYGRTSPGLAAAVREAGFELAFTTAWGVARPGSDPYALPRIEVHASDTPRKLRLKMALAGWPGLARDSLLTAAGVRLDPSSR